VRGGGEYIVQSSIKVIFEVREVADVIERNCRNQRHAFPETAQPDWIREVQVKRTEPGILGSNRPRNLSDRQLNGLKGYQLLMREEARRNQRIACRGQCSSLRCVVLGD